MAGIDWNYGLNLNTVSGTGFVPNTYTTTSTQTVSWPNLVLNQTWPEKREPGEYDEMELAAAHAKIDQLTEELKALVLRVQELESRGL